MSTYLKYVNHHVIFHSANVAYVELIHIIFKEFRDIVKSDRYIYIYWKQLHIRTSLRPLSWGSVTHADRGPSNGKYISQQPCMMYDINKINWNNIYHIQIWFQIWNLRHTQGELMTNDIYIYINISYQL